MTADTRALARDERTSMAEFLATLTPQEWDGPTLCQGWRVRDVVAHMYSYDVLGFGRLAVRMASVGFSVDRANAAGVADHADKGPEALLTLARDHVRPVGLTAMMGGRIALTDGMIHQQDIRRPLGRAREIPADRLVAALDTARSAPTIPAAKRIQGLRLVATDIDWTRGDGPEITGTAEALLMVIAGRDGVLAEVAGPGVAVLRDGTA